MKSRRSRFKAKSSFDIMFDPDDYAKSCSSKKRYPTEWQAKFAADECAARSPGLVLSWYRCGYCGEFHLTEVS